MQLLEENESKAIDSIQRMLVELGKFEALRKRAKELEVEFKVKEDDLGEQIAGLLFENVALKERAVRAEAENERLRVAEERQEARGDRGMLQCGSGQKGCC